MLPDPLIHIGYHKTGTTWLQRELFGAKSESFVALSPDGNPKYLGRLFIRDEDGYLLSPFGSNAPLVLCEVEMLRKSLEIGDRVPVISDENLTGNPQSGGFNAKVIADRLHESFPNGKIFCVIREQKDIILSNYLGHLKKGGTEPMRNFLTRRYDGRKPGFSTVNFRYTDLVSYYIQLFSPEQVLVLPYELWKSDPEDFIERLGRFVGTRIPFEKLPVEKVHNERRTHVIQITAPFVNLFAKKNSINAHSPLYIPGVDALLQKLNGTLSALFWNGGGPKLASLKRQVDLEIRDQFEISNRALSELIGLDLSAYGYHE